jgi:nucleoside-diphosphate-sugar epimerase
MRAFVTGATGFVGSRLLTALRANGDAVRALARPGRAPAAGHSRVTWVSGDVAAPESLRDGAWGCDVAFHCAHGGDDAASSHRMNVEGTLHVLEAARAAGVRRVVHVSTWRVHGRRLPAYVHEELPLVPTGIPYDVSKAEAERAASAFARRNDIELVILRPTLVYGPGSQPWVNELVDRLKYERLLLIDGGAAPANVVHVDDLVQAMLRAAGTPGAAGHAFLISGPPVSWRDYLGALSTLLGRSLPPSVSSRTARVRAEAQQWRFRFTRRPQRLLRGDLGLFGERSSVQTEKARALLGWQPAVDLEHGMAAVGERLRAEGRIGLASEVPSSTFACRAPRRLELEAG